MYHVTGFPALTLNPCVPELVISAGQEEDFVGQSTGQGLAG